MQSDRPIVLVTEPEFNRAEAAFTSATPVICRVAPPQESALVAAIRACGARHAIVGSVHYKDALYAALAAGGVVARYGVGHDGIDKELATRSGLFCTNTPGVLHQSVAELTMLFLLAAARHMGRPGTGMDGGTWAPRTGVELR